MILYFKYKNIFSRNKYKKYINLYVVANIEQTLYILQIYNILFIILTLLNKFYIYLKEIKSKIIKEYMFYIKKESICLGYPKKIYGAL